MLQLGLAMITLGLKILTSKEFLEFINTQVGRWWDEDFSNAEKKAAVMADAKRVFSQYSEQLVGMVISAVVGSIRLQIEAKK